MKNFIKKLMIILAIATVIIFIPVYKLILIKKKSFKNCSYEEHKTYKKAISDIACKILHKSKNPNKLCLDWCLDNFYNQYNYYTRFSKEYQDLWNCMDESIFNMYRKSNFNNINDIKNPIKKLYPIQIYLIKIK
jgi:hypothetical protein